MNSSHDKTFISHLGTWEKHGTKVRETNMNDVWKKVCLKFVNNFQGFENQLRVLTENIVEITKDLNLEVDEGNVELLLDSCRGACERRPYRVGGSKV